MKGFFLLALLLRVGTGWSGFSMVARGGHTAVFAAMLRVGDAVADMPDPESLLLMGTALCCGAALCVYRAARAKRAGAKDTGLSVGSASGSTG